MTGDGDEMDLPAFVPPNSARRVIEVARLALRAPHAELRLAEGDREPDERTSRLRASVDWSDTSAIELSVCDATERTWSADDRVLLDAIAAQFASELRLHVEASRYEASLRCMPGLLFERRVSETGEALCSFSGNSRFALAEIKKLIADGPTDERLDFISLDDRDAVRDAFSFRRNDDRDVDLLFRGSDTDEAGRWLHARAKFRKEADGATFLTGVCLDVTDAIASLPSSTTVPIATSQVITAVDYPSEGEFQSTPALDGADEDDQTALRILIADDLDLNRKLIADMLSLDGYLVDSVADGAAAVEAAKAKPYDLILMDMIMPGMDGMDATRAIRALPAPVGNVPIVALTAHSFREQLDNCLHAGMNATLTKPMSFDALSDAVSTWARSGRQAA